MDPTVANGTIDNVNNSWAGITRQINTTDFEQSNVEYLEFWLMDPFLEDNDNNGGVLTFNLGNISEDIIKDGRKQYENGLPEDGDISLLPVTTWGTVVPQNQSLVYAFSSVGDSRTNQDVGIDGYDDSEEEAALMCQAAFKIINPDKKFILKYTTVSGVAWFDGSLKKAEGSVVKSIK